MQADSDARPERVFSVSRDLVAEDVTVVSGTGRVVQVFINVVSNSRKYCDADRPELTIVARRRGGRIIVDFIDNGSGIPKASQRLIFEKFSRLTDTQQAGGAGLGLAICREIMTNLGGNIVYLPGQGGAAFRVSLPVKPEVAVADAAARTLW